MPQHGGVPIHPELEPMLPIPNYLNFLVMCQNCTSSEKEKVWLQLSVLSPIRSAVFSSFSIILKGKEHLFYFFFFFSTFYVAGR